MTRNTIQSSTFFNELLILEICKILPQRDIINVIKTCKFWCQVATPGLYNRIIINGSQCQDNCTLTKLQFDNENDLQFDNWMNFKIPIKNLSKLYQTLNDNKRLIGYIKVLEIFDCYKTELRFYILQILELILANSDDSFKLFKCHHTTSNQFYYQCSCYQDYWNKMMRYISNGNHIDTLCLNFNDFLTCFLNRFDYLDRVDDFEIILNSYELDKLDYAKLETENLQFERFYHKVTKLTINYNFEYFAKFIVNVKKTGNKIAKEKYDDLGFNKLETLNITIDYINDDIILFFTKIRKLKKLSLDFENDDCDKQLIMLLSILDTTKLTHLSIRLNSENLISKYLQDEKFSNLTHLSILNRFNDLTQFNQLLNSKLNLIYFNYQFSIDINWLILQKQQCNCTICDNIEKLSNHQKLIKIFITDLISFISPKYDYKYLDQDLNLDKYPIGKITNDILARINKDNNDIDMDINKCFMILEFIKHVLRENYISLLHRVNTNIRYLSIGGVPFDNSRECLIDITC